MSTKQKLVAIIGLIADCITIALFVYLLIR